MTDYDDIIDLPHHRSTRHPPMSRENRAAQFAPFAALTGYEASVREEARLTDNQIALDEEEIGRLNRRLAYLCEHLRDDPPPVVTVTYFVPDAEKKGGSYRTVEGIVRRIDPIEGVIVMADRTSVQMERVLSLEMEGV